MNVNDLGTLADSVGLSRGFAGFLRGLLSAFCHDFPPTAIGPRGLIRAMVTGGLLRPRIASTD